MGNLKEVRNRIASVKSTQQITKAMKMVSAAKLRKAQQRIVLMRPYAVKLKQMLSQLSASLEGSEALKFYEARPVKNVLVIVISADRGLAGSFNSSIGKEAIRSLKGKYQNIKVDIVTVGKKGRDAIIRANFTPFQENNGFFNKLTYEAAESIAEYAMQSFIDGKYDVVELVYNQFKNAAIFLTTSEQFLPIQENSEEGKSQFNVDYIFEPSKEEIVAQLVYQSLKIDFFRAVLESNAAEHGARMTAMDKATENASDLLKDLKLRYNRERQAAITNEILEIVGGAKALNS
ncbi:MAG: ATP synthase F1 subunit gamma [Bacteroidota bacterium]|nr:ATP synthase F1 subunit gamma [Bacteroidota bacterium]